MSNLLHRMYEPKVYDRNLEPRVQPIGGYCDAPLCGDPIYKDEDCILTEDDKIVHECCAEYLGLTGTRVTLDRRGNYTPTSRQRRRGA